MRPREIQALRAKIAAAGGLVNASELARAWGVSRERARQLTELDGFPEPIGHVGARPVWLLAQCDDWRAARQRPDAD